MSFAGGRRLFIALRQVVVKVDTADGSADRRGVVTNPWL